MEDKYVLETPQINKFTHENNVFSVAFKDKLINDMDAAGGVCLIDPITNNTTTTTSSTSNINFYAPDSSISAPKKIILQRTKSQIDSEKQDVKTNQNQNITSFSTLLSMDFNVPSLISKSNNETKPKMVDNTLNNVENKPNSLPIQIINEANLNPNITNGFELISDIKRIPSKDASNDTKNSKITKTDKSESLSSNSGSSYDDHVSSSDQTTEKKSKKRRLMSANSETRKEQIRNSNREAARRCRERKRNYIDFLEKKIQNLENKNTELLAENTNLKDTLSKHKNCLNPNNVLKSENNSNDNKFGALVVNNQQGTTAQINGVPVYLTVLPQTTNLTADLNEKIKLNQLQSVNSSPTIILPDMITMNSNTNNNSFTNNYANNNNNNSVSNDNQAIQKLIEALMAKQQQQQQQQQQQPQIAEHHQYQQFQQQNIEIK